MKDELNNDELKIPSAEDDFTSEAIIESSMAKAAYYDSVFRMKPQPQPEPNFVLAFDDYGIADPANIRFDFRVKKTLKARMKYGLFCKFFPFKIERWD